jgi:hypothetical protein
MNYVVHPPKLLTPPTGRLAGRQKRLMAGPRCQGSWRMNHINETFHSLRHVAISWKG